MDGFGVTQDIVLIHLLEELQYTQERNPWVYRASRFTSQTHISGCCMLLICALASGFIITAHPGLRGPGKYCGVIVFDRWDPCFLLSGHFITYISDGVKNELRPYIGKAMQLDTLEVSQPQNPGDAPQKALPS